MVVVERMSIHPHSCLLASCRQPAALACLLAAQPFFFPSSLKLSRLSSDDDIIASHDLSLGGNSPN